MRTVLLALGVLLAGCPSPAPAGPSVPADTTARDRPAPGPPALALDADGLRLVDPASGSTRLLAFGETSTDALFGTLLPMLGEPDASDVNEECGAGPLGVSTWPTGLTVLTADGLFVGWSVDGRADGSDGLATMSGVGTGTTRAEAEGSVVLAVSETTLGTEFAAGGLVGLLDGDGPDARITTLWAGASCVFR